MYTSRCLISNIKLQNFIINYFGHKWNTGKINFINLKRTISNSPVSIIESDYENDTMKTILEKYENKIIYNSIVEQKRLKLGYKKNKAAEEKRMNELRKKMIKQSSVEPIAISVKYLNSNKEQKATENTNLINDKENDSSNTVTQFPFENTDKVDLHVEKLSSEVNEQVHTMENEILARKAHFEANKENINWMTDYENYNDEEISEYENRNWKSNYGTPDPYSSVSNVPCGGCGALLHCKDTAIPGYIPSEIFKNYQIHGGQHLRATICQRCHFLKSYNMALQVRVSPEDYPKILETIKNNQDALVILMVDLLDFPCSIWPNIINIIGKKRPVVLVGNKVDLLPQDSRGYLERIKKILADTVCKTNLSKANIQHVSLISAKTGFGIEELITKLHNIWKYNGDVYLVGCTNVGKSTLFNSLLQSDYCKIQAVDLIQRATTSQWPGTTMNLLKFPILRPSGWRLYVRTKRLQSLNEIKNEENRLRKQQLQQTQNPKYATLIGHMERTFSSEEPITDEIKDIFAVQGHVNASGKNRIGINENEPKYKLSKWCYDTPGVVQPDQILHLLTAEELMLTIPKQLINPRTFSVKPGFTIFVAGLGRLDYLNGPESIRFTVFAAESLPITICTTKYAENVYKDLLGSELLQVPIRDKKRLEKWPNLESGNEMQLTGIDWEVSCADVVLSSAGWISVSLGKDLNCVVKAWTPDKRGIYIRDSLLSKAVSLRGRRIRYSPAYRRSKYFVQ